jgi:hypothetical protein
LVLVTLVEMGQTLTLHTLVLVVEVLVLLAASHQTMRLAVTAEQDDTTEIFLVKA